MRATEQKWFGESVPDKGPINPRESYANPPYPVGVPKIVVSKNFNVNWTVPDDVPYDGLLKVKVIPPKNFLYPLLPMHVDDMLLFPNCWACAKRAKNEFVTTKDVKKCNHHPAQRAFLETFTSIELRKALELGYKVIGFYRAYHFEQFDSQLFKGYVRMFLKIKVEATGWPAEMELGRDNTLEFGRPVKISEELSRVVYHKKEAFIREHKVSNIVLSLWTTSAARIKLYEYMEQVNKEEGSKLLYCDTEKFKIFSRLRKRDAYRKVYNCAECYGTGELYGRRVHGISVLLLVLLGGQKSNNQRILQEPFFSYCVSALRVMGRAWGRELLMNNY
ncbi:hypothetical protein niasHT_014544 [Heterodera trifolii]|uniref:DNA-directed DNA polymerase n=1 Tax=Heterodera trifolii TaxID=157864 RepID=A0ABD2L305_9BILA